MKKDWRKQNKKSIPRPQLLSSSRIPTKLTLNPYRHDPEGRPFRISFIYYNDKECQIDDLKSNGGRRVLKDIRTIGKCNAANLKDNNIKSKPVSNSGTYKVLFSGLPEGVDKLTEHISQGTSRIFYFYAEQDLYIVAITETHY